MGQLLLLLLPRTNRKSSTLDCSALCAALLDFTMSMPFQFPGVIWPRVVTGSRSRSMLNAPDALLSEALPAVAASLDGCVFLAVAMVVESKWFTTGAYVQCEFTTTASKLRATRQFLFHQCARGQHFGGERAAAVSVPRWCVGLDKIGGHKAPRCMCV
jgi:hypothetical protein